DLISLVDGYRNVRVCDFSQQGKRIRDMQAAQGHNRGRVSATPSEDEKDKGFQLVDTSSAPRKHHVNKYGPFRPSPAILRFFYQKGTASPGGKTTAITATNSSISAMDGIRRAAAGSPGVLLLLVVVISSRVLTNKVGDEAKASPGALRSGALRPIPTG
ncbi:hypothetical protein Pmar_PMAR027487, partial [Perkinsus marinus ATCC 50983]